MTFASVMDDYQGRLAAWLTQAKKAAAAVGKLRKAAAAGAARDLDKLYAAAAQAAADAAQAGDAFAPPTVDLDAYLGEGGGLYPELKAACAAAGVTLYEIDGVLFVPPLVVRPEPKAGGVRVGKKLLATLHPRALADLLKQEQRRPQGDRPEKFIETLLDAYEFARAKRRVEYIDLPLEELYQALTILPSVRREYPLMDFLRDLYALDREGVATTKKGFRLSLPSSTVSHTRGSKMHKFIAQDGTARFYAAVRFSPPGR